MRKGLFAAGLAACVMLGGATAAQAQFGGLGKILKEVGAPAIPNIFEGQAPISTSIKDATYGDPTRDDFVPPAAQQLTALERTDKGGFRLQPGYYVMEAQSYCLHAGTHGPTGGDGYLYAPVKGSARDAVIAILQNSNNHPEIEQHDIQLLLWAIVARAKFEDLDHRLQLTAAQLLTSRQLASLNRNALSVLTSSQLSSITGGLPGPLRTVVEAESKMRGLLTAPGGVDYSQIEQIAVLTGAAPIGPGSMDVPTERWSLHPDGYWIRYLPSGYSHTTVNVYVAPESPAVGKVYDPAQAIAVPGNTARQRLAQSGRIYAS
ncbi:conserved hypothetical protein [Altererythrobacter sp. B11]|uniref:hypothetical protein n=1 Tax=Altererythrobacter sp. B11 TaxID=2060312 RepID=UPI000DC70EDC|nr:hypothetical protein [Altererythrobacter sp. B11]BBC72461.1 conserved hypothetical protein [Altererythrobacter sp. B11]